MAEFKTCIQCKIEKSLDEKHKETISLKNRMRYVNNVPHSHFNYSSMEGEEFKKCWDLSNLRPYSAKQNILKGNK